MGFPGDLIMTSLKESEEDAIGNPDRDAKT